jgi:hypothetical protein
MAHDRNGDWIFLVNRDGSHLRRLGYGSGIHWSPDGKYLIAINAFWGGALYRYEVKTGAKKRLHEAVVYSAVYSPSGRCIAAVVGEVGLCLLDVEGKLLRKLPYDPFQHGVRSLDETLSW